MIGTLEEVGHFIHFALRAGSVAARTFARPGVVLLQLYRVLLGGLPLALATGLTLGIVIWMHTRGVLARSPAGSATDLLPTYLSAAVLLELAPIAAGLIAAARTGASLGAELGSMRLTEQVDALEVLGLSAWRELIGPRVLGCVLALPILNVFIAVLAIGGSLVAEMLAGTMPALQYYSACYNELRFGEVLPAGLKTLVFGYLVGVSGCYFGMAATGGTEGVGRAATRGVVLATLLVLVADVFLVAILQWV